MTALKTKTPPLSALEIAQDLIRIPSVTPDSGACISYIENYLAELGFSCARYDKTGTANLFAILEKGVGPHLCFAGHTDVVPSGKVTQWKHPPFAPTIDGGFLYGRGVADMKGAIACFLESLSRFNDFTGTLSLLITGDEEGPATFGTPYLLNQVSIQPDLCIIGEPSAHKQAGDQIKVGRRGSLTGSITFLGEQGHVAYPHLAQNPIKTAAAFVSLMERTSLDHGTDVFDPSHLEFTSFDVGNATSNLIPGRATLRFALRFNPLHTEDSLKDLLREKIESLTNTYSMETTLNGVPFYHNNPDAVSRISCSIERITGQKPTLSTSGGTSDGRFISSLCPVIECGFSNETIHKANERVSLEDFNQLTRIYDVILKDFFA